MKRIDHVAWRVFDRHKSAQHFINLFNYEIIEEFKPFDNVSCSVLRPREISVGYLDFRIFSVNDVDYHLPPEIFISDGSPDSIVGRWVREKGQGIHHIAYETGNIYETVDEYKKLGYEFSSEKPITCPGLTQIFTRPIWLLGGLVIEFIQRESHGFCKENVRDLMLSTDINN